MLRTRVTFLEDQSLSPTRLYSTMMSMMYVYFHRHNYPVPPEGNHVATLGRSSRARWPTGTVAHCTPQQQPEKCVTHESLSKLYRKEKIDAGWVRTLDTDSLSAIGLSMSNGVFGARCSSGDVDRANASLGVHELPYTEEKNTSL